MRNISFSATTEQVRHRRKHVTRRYIRPGKKSIWQQLKPDEHLMGIEKGQGLKKGEKVVRLGEIVVLEATVEPLMDIVRRPQRAIRGVVALQHKDCFTPSEVRLEGFPEMSPVDFVKFFCKMNKCEPEAPVVRILFDYCDPVPGWLVAK